VPTTEPALQGLKQNKTKQNPQKDKDCSTDCFVGRSVGRARKPAKDLCEPNPAGVNWSESFPLIALFMLAGWDVPLGYFISARMCHSAVDNTNNRNTRFSEKCSESVRTARGTDQISWQCVQVRIHPRSRRHSPTTNRGPSHSQSAAVNRVRAANMILAVRINSNYTKDKYMYVLHCHCVWLFDASLGIAMFVCLFVFHI
jgi:hypothetical protein